jgi:Tol biopolymer transport system component
MAMTPERWKEIDRVWHAVLARPEADRAAALVELCAGDAELRREVELLLANRAQASAAGFGSTPGVATRSSSLVGMRLGTYTVHTLLGVGGMGEVYQAHDSTLGRDVALKILPDLWLDDPDRRARFDREARVLASLSHPNIGAIYGTHESDGIKALVLELVEGETLADRIFRQPLSGRGLPIDEVASMAAQIIDALDAAHQRGIVHRDLKPANIKITPDGHVKVLDFGLARPVSEEAGDARAHSPTVTVATKSGVLLGTAAYMSPEQARGRAVDKRTDIWAFGCVLFEMLTGTPAFGGDSVSDVLANVIKGDIQWRALPADTPAAMRVSIERCLERNPRQRFHDIADVRLAVGGAFDARVPDLEPRAVTTARGGWVWPALAAVFAIATAVAIWAPWRRPPVLEVARFQIPVPDGTSFSGALDLSPDGRRLVFGVQDRDGRRRLWVRDTDSLTARPIPGTELSGVFSGGVSWSPDSRSIAFSDGDRLMKVDLSISDAPLMIAKLPVQAGESTWNSHGDILVGGITNGPIWRASAAGGDATPLTKLIGNETAHGFPSFLPDGRHFLYFRVESGGPGGRIHVGSIEATPEGQVTGMPLLASDSQAVYVPSTEGQAGWVLFVRGRQLLAHSFNPSSLSLSGEPQLVASRVTIGGSRALFSAVTGAVAFVSRSGSLEYALTDRAGRVAERPGDSSETSYGTISPSGSHVAFDRVGDDNNTDIWVTEIARNVSTRLTFDPARDEFPIWSPDGRRILFRSSRGGVDDLYEKAADVVGDERLVLHTGAAKWPGDWSRDGRYVLYEERTTQDDLWVLPMSGADQRPVPVTRTGFQENHPRFSPDGRWISYQSNQSGRWEIYIRAFVPPGSNAAAASSAVYQVSRDGGQRAQWRQDGKELAYIAGDNAVVVVDVTAASPRVTVGPPRPLFRLPVFFTEYPRLDMRSDGQQFLIKTENRDGDAQAAITVAMNWQAAMRR